MFETKILAFGEAKLDDSAGPGRLAGYASVWNGVDSYGDTIVRGAYKATIPDFLRDGFIPWGHDWAGYPVATPDKAREDEHGLWIEAVFHTDPESQRARQIVAERLERGKSMGLSIGYQAKGFDFQEVDGQQVRRLLDIELMEVSLVMVPADASAQVASVKAKRRLSRHQLEAVIATLQALVGDDDEAEDLSEAAGAEPTDDDGKASPDLNVIQLAHAEPIALLRATVDGLKAADDDDVLAARDEIATRLADLGVLRGDLEALLKRADLIGSENPRALFRQFRRLEGLYGPIQDGRRAG